MKAVKAITIRATENRIQTLESMKDNFIRFLDVAPLTVQSYTSGLKQYFLFLRINSIKTPDRNSVIEFKNALTEQGRKASTIALYLAAVKRFFTWCENEGICKNFTAGIKAPKVDKFHKKDCFSGSQIKEIMQTVNTSSLQGLRDFAILALVSVCGLRCCEVVRADIQDLQLNAGKAILHIRGKGKTSKADFVNLPAKVLEALRAYLKARGNVKPSEPLFASCSRRNKGQRLTTRSISGICKKAMVRAGFISARLTAHSLRHSAVTLALMGGLSLPEVQAFARHSSMNTTLVYFHGVNRLKSECENVIARQIF